jgi:hypothetical protein
VVDDVTRTHHADVYEMKTEERPVKIMAPMMLVRDSTGKFFAMFAEDQSYTISEAKTRMGMVRRLL